MYGPSPPTQRPLTLATRSVTRWVCTILRTKGRGQWLELYFELCIVNRPGAAHNTVGTIQNLKKFRTSRQ